MSDIKNGVTANHNQTHQMTVFCQKVLHEILSMNLSQRKGGYLTILDAKTGGILAVALIGEIAQKNLLKYFNFSLEKAQRVYTEEISSSYQSRNLRKGKWAGAIRGKEYIYSFSGNTEENDEAICLMLCYDTERYIPDEFKTDTRIDSEVRPIGTISSLENSNWEPVRLVAQFFTRKAIPA